MDKKAERAILVLLKLKKDCENDFHNYQAEMEALAEAAGAKAEVILIQSRERIQGVTYLGKGKIEELKHLITEYEPDLVIFDRELSPVQMRNLQKILEVKIVDRTSLILDIFSQRARSHEGRLQVELASLEYRLPRLTGKGKEMSRLGAGIGTRGAGEQKLEMDRRYIRGRIDDIKRQIEKIQKTRSLHRKQRERSGIRTVSLVGYTNAGKSSLFNALCSRGHTSGQEQVEADSRLFQTLDTTTRRIRWTDGQEILITDTVGFIQNMPHNLTAAFKSTFEETAEADLILHVVDIADANYMDKIEAAEKILQELGADKTDTLLVFNKIDLVEGELNGSENIYISAQNGKGLDQLMERILVHFKAGEKDK
ncbi:MAG TPA: GTPase HflX [Syntrophomonadaceae bacterium]|nr:GTPase HflX [Syntrophomonadaceae bacterium]HPR93901.1 GTPase HflX [Syntrophomonadaceae bacterium]